MSKLSEFLFGGKDKTQALSKLTPEQDQLLKLITEGLSKGDGPLKDLFGGFDEGAFKKGVSDPALKMFREQILPQLNEKFIAGNQSLGSGMRNAQMKAGVDLQSRLAELMYGAQQDQNKNRLTGINQALGTGGVENLYMQGKTGVLPAFFQGAGSKLGSAAGSIIAG